MSKKECKKLGVFGLFKSQRKIDQIKGYIFGKPLKDIFDYRYMENEIAKKIEGYDCIELYVNGLNTAVVELHKYCMKNKIQLTYYHYDRKNKEYYTQDVYIP